MDLLAAYFGLILVAIALTRWQLRDGSFRVPAGASEMVFRSRFPLGLVVILVGLPVFCLLQTLSPSLRGDLRPVVNLVGSVVVGLIVLMLRALKESLVLDTERFTYRIESVTLFGPRVRSGSCHDFAGVYVRPWSSHYWVALAWRDGRQERIWLGVYGSCERAQALATEVAEAVGLCVIAAPPLGGRR